MKEGWTYKKLGEVCEIHNGFAFKSNQYVPDGIRVVRITNVQKGYVEDKDPKFYPLETQSELKRYLIKENDLLISLTGNVGRVGIINNKLLPAYLNQRVGCLRTKKNELFIPFLFYFLNSNKFENDCIESSTGVAQKNMSTVWLSNYMIPTPPLSEQQRIVSRLDAAFAHIDELKANAEKQLSEARTLFQKALAKAMESKKGWEEKKMGDVCEVNRGRSKHRPRNDKRLYGGNYPFIQTGDIHCAHGGILKSYSQTYSDFGLAQSRLWKKGTICITIAANIGETAILGMDACFPDSVVGIFPNEVLLNAYFLNYYLVSIKEAIDKLSYGTAQKNINLEILNNLIISFPPLPEQQRIVSRLDAISAHIRELEEVLQKTIVECDALKQALLRKVFE